MIRNVGGRVTPGTLQTLMMLQNVGRAPRAEPASRFDLIVLQHTECGITHLEDKPDLLAGYFGIGKETLNTKAISDPRTAVAVDVAALRVHPLMPRPWVVSGLVYDVHTGLVEVVVPPEPVLS